MKEMDGNSKFPCDADGCVQAATASSRRRPPPPAQTAVWNSRSQRRRVDGRGLSSPHGLLWDSGDPAPA